MCPAWACSHSTRSGPEGGWAGAVQTAAGPLGGFPPSPDSRGLLSGPPGPSGPVVLGGLTGRASCGQAAPACLTPALPRRLAPMRLYTLSKRHFVLVFVVFFVCFGLTVFVGIKGRCSFGRGIL